jgi:hypothetical protein
MATRPRFRTIWQKMGPRWLVGEGDGALVAYSLGVVLDAFVERLRLGFLVHMPQQDPSGTPAPDDALIEMGRDRREIRGMFETSAEYAARMKGWLDDRRKAGTARMLLRKLAAYTGPGVAWRVVDVRGNWYSRTGDGIESQSLQANNWHWDNDSERWSRFWVICYPNGLWSEYPHKLGDTAAPKWGEFTNADTIGTTMTQEHVATLKHIVREWKPYGTRGSIIVAFDPNSFNPSSPEPDGTWAHHSKVVGGVRVRARLRTARYIDGV